MTSLWPGIGKEQMENFDRSFGQQVLNGITGFKTQHAHIVDLVSLATGFFNPTGDALDTKKVFLGHPRGQRKKKCTVAAAKIDMERRSAPEDFLRIETGGTRIRDQFDHGEQIASAGRCFNLASRGAVGKKLDGGSCVA